MLAKRIVLSSYIRVHLRLSPLKIKLRLRWLAIVRQRALRANCVRALEDPVLPRRQTAVDLRVHSLRPGKTKRRFHAGQSIGRKRSALFNRYPNFVFPIEIVRPESDEASSLGRFGI